MIVGHSIAGLTAIAYARRYPDNVAGVVLVGAPPVGFLELPPAVSSFFDEDADEERRLAHQHNLATRRVPSTLTRGHTSSTTTSPMGPCTGAIPPSIALPCGKAPNATSRC